VTSLRKLASAVALASLFAAAPAFAGNRDGFDVKRGAVDDATEHCCASCPNMSREHGSGGDAGDRTSTPAVDPFDRSMDAGG
jgi:hypothetical protein